VEVEEEPRARDRYRAPSSPSSFRCSDNTAYGRSAPSSTDDTDDGGRERVGLTAARPPASSSSARILASACRSLHVNFPLEPPTGRGGADCAARAASTRASDVFFSFLGGGRETGVYAVPFT